MGWPGIVWYRHGSSEPWQCYFALPPSPQYSRPVDWLRNAERMMRGDRSNVLWRKTEDDARRLIWC